MDVKALVNQARSAGRAALTEYESKQLLKAYGVPVVEESIARDAKEALSAARQTGFPVVIKGLGQKLLHKTERGLVELDVRDEAAVSAAATRIISNAGDDLEGLLIQPQIQGRRELVAGLFRDPQFGPMVMFGIGGVFAEAVSDVTFRAAPLTEKDAEEMLDEIRAKSIIGNFRGESAADRDQLVRTLMGLARVGMDFPEISEIDINPLLLTPDGQVVAVDALMVFGEPEPDTKFLPAVDPAHLGYLFYPKSIAFIGASGQMGKWGHTLFALTASRGYEGKVYLVNPKGGEIAGRPVYPSVTAIPEKVDLAVVTIPAAGVMNLIPELAEKGIRNMLLITSGFGETGADGKAAENELVRRAREAGILIVGPNTMGICNPHINLYCTGSHVWPQSGSTAVVAQSGNMGTQLLAFAEQQGIGIRAFCGSGNEGMVTIEDYIDAFEVDDLTRTVMLYVESVKNGRRFFESARRVGKKKPVVLLKGGRSQAGNRAAASHTGAMTSDSAVFDAVCRQAGIVKVERSMDLLDLAAAFSSLPLPKGNRTAILTLGGGWGVVTADLCAEYGLDVPELSKSIIASMDELLPPYWSRSNPVDIVGENDMQIPMIAIEELLKWDGCDAVINLGIMGRRILVKRLADSISRSDAGYSEDFLEGVNRHLIEFENEYVAHIVRLMETYQKPVFGVSLLKEERDQTLYRVEGSDFKGVFYETPERAVKAFAKMLDYYRFLNR